MSRRIEVELTSERPDGSWTWRAAGAREPRGVLDGALLPAGSKVGDVVRTEADSDIDGITVLAVLPQKGDRKEPERLTLVAEAPFQPVISTLAERGAHERRDRPERVDRPDRGPRPDRGARPERSDRGSRPDRGPRPERGTRSDRPDGAARPEPSSPDRRERPPRTDRPGPIGRAEEPRPRPPRPERPPVDTKPKPKRLRPGRANRDAVLNELPEEHRPIAETVLRGGVPAVRTAIEEQNAQRRAANEGEITGDALVALAENLLPKLRIAEWRDRAEAALAHAEEVDLRDLRSVMAAANDAARDERARELTTQLREALNKRQDREFAEWLAEITTNLNDKRVVRALRLSSRPPKAGVPFPAELAARVAQATSAALTADGGTDRWIAVIDALALSPVRALVVPASLPAEPAKELLDAVVRFGSQLPKLAAIFGVTPAPPPKMARRPRPPRPAPRPRSATTLSVPAKDSSILRAQTPPEAGFGHANEEMSVDTRPDADASDATDAGEDTSDATEAGADTGPAVDGSTVASAGVERPEGGTGDGHLEADTGAGDEPPEVVAPTEADTGESVEEFGA